jgi:hypothetical protein
VVIPGRPIFRTFFWGNFGENSAEIFPPKNVGKKMEFSAEKVLKNCFSKKFRGIFRGKKCKDKLAEFEENLAQPIFVKFN